MMTSGPAHMVSRSPGQKVREVGAPAADGDPLAAVFTVEHQLSVAEVRQLAALAADVPGAQAIVEIGSYRGGSAIALALGAEQGWGSRVYAVDPHAAFVGARGATFGPADQAALYANVTRLGLGERIFVVSLPSTAAARAWNQRDIGLLWIDGDHRYEAVRQDLEAWYPHVVDGGVIALHDTDYDEVQRAVRWAVDRRMIAPMGGVAQMAWFRRI